eukprot:10135128-Alexandrium_andersonii.AAC.1
MISICHAEDDASQYSHNFTFEPLMDLSEEALRNPHNASRFYLPTAPGAPAPPGSSAYDRVVLHLGDS